MNRRPDNLTGSSFDGLVGSANRRSHLKSVQRGTVTLTTTATTNTATITAVNTAYAVLSYTGTTITSGGGDSSVSPSAKFCKITLTNSTTITVTRNANSDLLLITVFFEVREYYPGSLRQVVYGSISVNNPSSSGTATVAINDTTKAYLSWLGFNTDQGSAGALNTIFPSLVITNATTITTSIPTATANYTIPYCLIEEW